MFFYLEHRFQGSPSGVQIMPADAGAPCEVQEQTLYLQAGVQGLESWQLPGGGRLLLLGDPVFEEKGRAIPGLCDSTGQINLKSLYTHVRGHYNWFYLHDGAFSCGNSFGALFPLYYQIRPDRVLIGSSPFFLAKRAGDAKPDRRYLLERLLFNYPFFQSSCFAGIRLLDAHSRLSVSAPGARVERAFAVEAHFGSGSEQSTESLNRLTELFEAESRLFLPDTPFAISFTGGFDGRTLVAAARNAGRNDFFTYSFGMPHEADVTYPAAQARVLNIPYQPILLDQNYVDHHAGNSARAFLQLSDYNGNYGRPHYHYAAQLLSGQTGYLLTGNFGSELFRAMHQPGVMMSEALIRIFAAADDSWKDALRQAPEGPAAAYFQPEMEALIADLEQYLGNKKDLDPNQRFYVFVLEEIFRKYFGPELVMQRHYLRNRTPYLSLRFFQALNETIWSGVHTRLFEKQKNKRLKGQIFYSAFLRRTDPQLYRLPTNKGYSPADVLETWRRPLLLARVLRQKLFRQETGDSNAVETWFRQQQGELARAIKAQECPELLRSGIAASMENNAADDLEKTIHHYSVAAAWAAAARFSTAETPPMIV